ncbi:hypothetical protein BKG80_19035 [Mycobacteroides chelonae]|uniref:hypothetical protein n=1 Tax=Mycobacteroides chelonae TaxID=1774 RepID=UPI0008A92916|nr:hypothetical protein [Mycobacteroides chelonae]MBF9349285.1 hypothetical protein [Mycobacteroides chelonae]OHU34980.1 hypothetical protein BKG80_19035 [Mycobacteroides chelonae]
MTDEIAMAYQASSGWQTAHGSRGVFINADFAPEDEAQFWVEELLNGVVAAMADAGVFVELGNVRTVESKVFATLDGRDFMVRDVEAEGGKAPYSLERVLARFARIAADRACTQRWYYFYDGDPVGMAYFVRPDELKTAAGLDVRELGTAEQWYQAEPD